jgi:hypothetical protein
VGTPVPFQRCLVFIIATANKEFTLTAGKFVPVSNVTMMNVSISVTLFSLCSKSISELAMRMGCIKIKTEHMPTNYSSVRGTVYYTFN